MFKVLLVLGTDKKICHIFFVLTVIALTAFKWHDFHLPYFWDELGAYSQAAGFQFHHALSLMPGSVPPFMSCGHPLFFMFINAAAMRVFGEQVLVTHLFCFSISVLLLLAVYLKIGKYFNPVTGLLSAVILAAQPLFLAQCGFVLPEITLSFFVFLAICSYYENRFLLFALFASLAVLTKEAAVVVPVAALAYSFIKWAALRTRPAALRPAALVLTLVPYLIFGVFLVLQKKQYGWYMFPLHVFYFSLNSHTYLKQIEAFYSFVLFEQGRITLFIVIMAGVIISLLRSKWNLVRVARSFVFLLLLLGVADICRSSFINLYMSRYLLVPSISFSVCTAVALTTISKNKFFIACCAIAVLIISSQNLEDRQFKYDADLGYRREVNSLQQGVNYLLETAKPGEKMYSGFPGNCALSFAPGGYLGNRKIDPALFDKNADHYLLSCNPGDGLDVDSSRFRLKFLKRFDDGYAHVEIYRAEKR